MVLDVALLNTQQSKVYVKGKVEQSREVAIKKGAFGSPLTKVANFTFYFYYSNIGIQWLFFIFVYCYFFSKQVIAYDKIFLLFFY